MTQDMLTSFFGWMTVLNFGLLAFATLAMLVMRDWVAGLHGRLFGLDEAQVRLAFYSWLAGFKILAIVGSLVPYLALRLI